MKWNWVMVASVSFLVTACSKPAVCPDPGGIPTKDRCFHYETIKEKNDQTKEVRGTVNEGVIKEDQKDIFNFYDLLDYRYNIHQFHVQVSDYEKLEAGKSYMLVNEPGQSFLKICETDACNAEAMRFKKYHKD